MALVDRARRLAAPTAAGLLAVVRWLGSLVPEWWW